LSSTISNCFSHASFHSDNIVLPSSEHEETDLEVPQVTEEYITVEDHVATAETLTDDDIIEAVTNPDSEEDEMKPSTDQLSENTDEVALPSAADARSAMRTIELFFLTSSTSMSETDKNSLKLIDKSLQDMFMRYAVSKSRQKRIDEFFNALL